jgi:hypothetical protein
MLLSVGDLSVDSSMLKRSSQQKEVTDWLQRYWFEKRLEACSFTQVSNVSLKSTQSTRNKSTQSIRNKSTQSTHNKSTQSTRNSLEERTEIFSVKKNIWTRRK